MATVYVGNPIAAYTLVSNWRFTTTASGISGTREYIESADMTSVTGATASVVPKIGDAWDTTYTAVTCKSIEIRYLGDNENCPKIYVCSYDDTPVTQTEQPVGEDDLPRSMSITGELISWEPKPGTWKWKGTGLDCNQPIYRHVSTEEIVVTRVIKDIDDYNSHLFGAVNKTNNYTLWGFQHGSLLFVGADITEFRNRAGAKRWKVDLKFVARKVLDPIDAGSNTWGWNTQLNEDTGKWDSPWFNGATYLYPEWDFSELFTKCPLGSDENLYQIIPKK
jgi:hypothetical protein